MRLLALEALARVGPAAKEALPRIQPALKDEEVGTRLAAAQALWQIAQECKESLPVLKFLWEHQVKPEFTCRFRWQPGSLALWDNRAAMHNPINDYHGYRRVLHRITLAGDKPR